VDQLEELFVLNAPEVQARFASFLGRLAEEADVHVLLSLRDDFLFRCGEQECLRPIFQDLTPLWVAVSPDSHWVASSGERDHVRLWPVPDVSRTPLHRRSHEELLTTLRSWTNLRAVKDPQSPTGWTLEPVPFPGWAKLPQR
jgi:hypothetical protein